MNLHSMSMTFYTKHGKDLGKSATQQMMPLSGKGAGYLGWFKLKGLR